MIIDDIFHSGQIVENRDKSLTKCGFIFGVSTTLDS